MSDFKFISDDKDYRHLDDKDRYKELYEEVGHVDANKKIEFREEWMKYFRPLPGKTILELGAHNGPNLIHYARIGHKIVGVELSNTLINTFYEFVQKEKEEVSKRIKIHQGWIEEFTSKEKFDYVLCTEILEHVINPVEILKIAEKCLSEDGTLYISSPSTHWGNNTHVRGVPKADLKKWLDEANLSSIELWEEDNRTFCYARKKIATRIIGLLRVRNEEFLIKDTLDHLANFCNGGVFVYDDCSTDKTVEICTNHPIVKSITQGTEWDLSRERAEYENRAAVLKKAKEFATESDWFVYIDADERIEHDWDSIGKLSSEIIGIKMKLFDYYITENDINKRYDEREWIGPEYRSILMVFKNLSTLSFHNFDQREVELGSQGVVLEEGYVKHYGKAVSVEQWESTCDYYSKYFHKYSEKWEKRKGKAIHQGVSDFNNELIRWNEKEEKGFLMAPENNQNKKLKILITNHHLMELAGSEILTFTLADYLSRAGHQLTVYSKYLGSIKRWFDEKNIRVVDRLESIAAESFDVAHIHHNISAIEVRQWFPKIPIVFYSQGVLPFLENPPLINVNIYKYLAISEEVGNKLNSFGIPQEKIEIIRNIIDSEKFSSCRPSNEIPQNVLVISGRIDQSKEQVIRNACLEKGLNLQFVGGRFGSIDQTLLKEKIEWADIVFSLGRGAIEGMIAGRAVIIYDYLGGDGIVTDETYSEIQKNNFSGRRYGYSYDKDDIIAEIEKYNLTMVQRVKRIAIEDYAAFNTTKKLEKIYIEAINFASQQNISDEEMPLIKFANNIIMETLNYAYENGFRNGKESVVSTNRNERHNGFDTMGWLATLFYTQIEGHNFFDAYLLLQILVDRGIIKNKDNRYAEHFETKVQERKKEIGWNSHKSSKTLHEAERLIEKQNLKGAKEKLLNVLNLEPEHVEALNDFSVVSILEGNVEYAHELIRIILRIEPTNEVALGNLKYIQEMYKEFNDENKLFPSESIENKEYEDIACPFCNSLEAEEYRTSADIVKCKNCDTIYLRHRFTKEAMYKWYQSFADGDSHMALPSSIEDAKKAVLRRNYWLQEMLKYTEPKGTLLDIGCGWGAFLDNARDNGFVPRGIEMTKKCVNYANDTLKIKVTNDQFEDTHFEQNSINVITMNHVFEHLPYPLLALKKVHKILVKEGLFCGIVPNISSFVSRNLTEQWYWLEPNNHYVHYSPETLKKHLEQNGFKVERLYTATGDYGKQKVIQAINNYYEVNNNVEEILNNLKNNLMGEEIRFIARKI